MKRYKLYQGKMREDENGIYVKYEDVTGLFSSNGVNAVLGDGWRDARKELPEESGMVLCWADGVYKTSYYDKEYMVFFDDAHDMMMLDMAKTKAWWKGKTLPDSPAFA